MQREMKGAELKSVQKSSIHFKSLNGIRCKELNLPTKDIKWWMDAKIGMFIHWGLYSILGKGEWVRFNEDIPKEEYEALADKFIPEDFDMHEWTELAKSFGAKYSVMVTKHHDGFSLWNSAGSYEYFTSWHRGAKRDFVKEFTDACRDDNLRVGLYYSPMDWRFPGYFDPKGKPENAELMKNQCYAQVKELCSQYGAIDILWYDGGWLAHDGTDADAAWLWEPIKLNKMARSYNPKMLINPRSGWDGDFHCDEGSHEISGNIVHTPWEKNMNVCSGKSWGWMEENPVSDFDWLIRMMVNVVCRGGNWLVNIGPDRNGKIPAQVRQRMKEVGDWLGKYGDSIYGTRGGPLEPVDGIYGSTYKEKQIYLHILDIDRFKGEKINLRGYKILHAEVLLGDNVEIRQEAGNTYLNLPDMSLRVDTIVVLHMKDSINPD